MTTTPTPVPPSRRTRRAGILVGRERTFPDALIQEVNRRDAGVKLDYAEVFAARADAPPDYDVVIDRISHEVPCYQPWLKVLSLHGARIINNPFWRIADDKFFDSALAAMLGVRVPKTVLLPSKSYGDDINDASLEKNLRLVDWDGVVRDLGLPIYLKPHWGGGWRDVTRCTDLAALHAAYDKSGRLTMIAQEEIRWTRYVRCIVIGRKDVLPALWDPRLSHFDRYARAAETMPPLGPELEARAVKDALTLTRALGYDMNTVELAFDESGEAYAIDFMNSAPDLDISSLGESHFRWSVEKTADLVVRAAFAPKVTTPRWDAELGLTGE